VSNVGTGVTGGSINCGITNKILTCGPTGSTVTFGTSNASFDVSFTATPSAAATFINPREGFTCSVDPIDVVGGETSEANNSCSDNVTVIPPPGTDLVVTATHTPDPVMIGDKVTLTAQLNNQGPIDAADVVLSDTLPTSMTFVSASLPGWSCITPAVGSTGSVSCSKVTFSPGGATLTVVAKTTMSGSFDNAAQVTTSTQDTTPGNESDTDAITVSTNARGCTIVGTSGADVIDGTPGADVICGWGGADHIDGKGGADRILGQAGADTLIGGAGADKLLGGGANDTLDGSDGAGGDVVDGQSGTDSCTFDPGDTVKHCE